MKNGPPSEGGPGIKANKFKFRDAERSASDSCPHAADLYPTPWAPLDPTTLAALRRIWWRLRQHHAVLLPAQSGVILLDGGLG